MSVDIGPLTVVDIALVGMSARAVVRLRRGSPTSRGIGVAALVVWLVLACTGGLFEARHQWVQAKATGVVVAVSGNPDARALCARWTADLLNLSQNKGMVSWDEPTVAHLRPSTCATFADWLLSDKRRPTVEQVTALHVVVHEAVHVSGQTNEALTECRALQLDAQVAESLGASATVAQQMVATYTAQVYPHLSPDYRTDCASVP